MNIIKTLFNDATNPEIEAKVRNYARAVVLLGIHAIGCITGVLI